MENIKKALKLKQYINPRPLILEEYYNIINKFKKIVYRPTAPALK